MIKLGTLSRWVALKKGDVLTLPGKGERRIRLEVNSPGRVSLYRVCGEGTITFLASPVGRDVVEFTASGDLGLTTDHDDVSVYTAEREPTCCVIEDAEVFTKIAQRKARNPDLEHLMFIQQQNMERRFAALAHDVAERVSDAYDEGRASAAVSDGAGAAAGNSGTAEPEPDADKRASGKGKRTAEPAAGSAAAGDQSGNGHAVDDEPEVHPEPKV